MVPAAGGSLEDPVSTESLEYTRRIDGISRLHPLKLARSCIGPAPFLAQIEGQGSWKIQDMSQEWLSSAFSAPVLPVFRRGHIDMFLEDGVECRF